VGTEFTEIYTINEILKNDNRLLNKTPNQIYELYFTYLKYGIGIFKSDCKYDLAKRTDFSQKEYFFISDGEDNEYQLSSVPPVNSQFYIGYRQSPDFNYTQVIDYSYNQNNNSIIINTPLIQSDYEIYISVYRIGSFDNTLDEAEINILSESMLIPWSVEKVMTRSLLNQMITLGSSKLSGTQANHIDALSKVADNQYFIKVMGMINRYSYKNNNLMGLGGGLV
jgi:hypothetical protein